MLLSGQNSIISSSLLIQRSWILYSLAEEHLLVPWFLTTRDIIKCFKIISRKLLGVFIY